jgi:hypothetical protein
LKGDGRQIACIRDQREGDPQWMSQRSIECMRARIHSMLRCVMPDQTAGVRLREAARPLRSPTASRRPLLIEAAMPAGSHWLNARLHKTGVRQDADDVMHN